jgi:hypothetical protein
LLLLVAHQVVERSRHIFLVRISFRRISRFRRRRVQRILLAGLLVVHPRQVMTVDFRLVRPVSAVGVAVAEPVAVDAFQRRVALPLGRSAEDARDGLVWAVLGIKKDEIIT